MDQHRRTPTATFYRERTPSVPRSRRMLTFARVITTFLAIIPIHLAPTAIYLLRYVASLPTVDGGKFLLGLYVLFVDLANFYIPNIGQMTDLVIPLHVIIEACERIAKIYLATMHLSIHALWDRTPDTSWDSSTMR